MDRPYVILNVAATVDGKIDTYERHGAAISSEGDRERVDGLRASVDGVMVGGRTLHHEDPRLTVKSAALRAERIARGEPANPAKIAVASRPRFGADSRFLSEGDPRRIILFVESGFHDAALEARGVELYRLGSGRVDLAASMAKLHGLGIRRVLVEGGGTLNFELLQLGLVDEVQVFVAPLIFGGATAPTLADGQGLTREVALKLRRVEVQPGRDGGVLLRYMVEQQ
jgi:2,5-diamino-6-(ribosylamino)-4(3H)-pyrimidinone 5'-phosphate reductase